MNRGGSEGESSRLPLGSPASYSGTSHFPPSSRSSRYSRAPLPSLPFPTATEQVQETPMDMLSSPSTWTSRKSRARASMLMFPGSPRSTVKSPRVRQSQKRSPLKHKRQSSRPSLLRASVAHASMNLNPAVEEAVIPAALSISLAWTHIAPSSTLKSGLATLTKSLGQLRMNLVTMQRDQPDKIAVGSSFHSMSPRVLWGQQQVAFIQDTEMLSNILLHRLHCINSLRPVQSDQKTLVPARDLVNSRCEEQCQLQSTPALKFPAHIMECIPDTYEAISQELMQSAEPLRRADIALLQNDKNDNFNTAFHTNQNHKTTTPVGNTQKQPQLLDTSTAGQLELRLQHIDVVQVFKDTIDQEMQPEEKMDTVLRAAFFPTKMTPVGLGGVEEETSIVQEEEYNDEDEENIKSEFNDHDNNNNNTHNNIPGTPTVLRNRILTSPSMTSPSKLQSPTTLKSPTLKSPSMMSSPGLKSPYTPSIRSPNPSIYTPPTAQKNVKFHIHTSPAKPLWSPGSPRNLTTPRTAFSPETPSNRKKKRYSRHHFFTNSMTSPPAKSTVSVYAVVLSTPPLLSPEVSQTLLQVTQGVLQMPTSSSEHRKMLAGLSLNQCLSEQGSVLSRTGQQEAMVRLERVFSKESVAMPVHTKRTFPNLSTITTAKAWIQTNSAGKPVVNQYNQQIEVEQLLSPNQLAYTPLQLAKYLGCEAHIVLVVGKLGVNEFGRTDELLSLPLSSIEEEAASELAKNTNNLLFARDCNISTIQEEPTDDEAVTIHPIISKIMTIPEEQQVHTTTNNTKKAIITQFDTISEEDSVATVQVARHISKGIIRSIEVDDDNVSIDFLMSHLNEASNYMSSNSTTAPIDTDYESMQPTLQLYKQLPDIEQVDDLEIHGVSIIRRPIHMVAEGDQDQEPADDWNCQIEHVMQSLQQAKKRVHCESVEIHAEDAFLSPARSRWSAAGVLEVVEEQDASIEVVQVHNKNIVRGRAIFSSMNDELMTIEHTKQILDKKKKYQEDVADMGDVFVQDVRVKQSVQCIEEFDHEDTAFLVVEQKNTFGGDRYSMESDDIEGDNMIVMVESNISKIPIHTMKQGNHQNKEVHIIRNNKILQTSITNEVNIINAEDNELPIEQVTMISNSSIQEAMEEQNTITEDAYNSNHAEEEYHSDAEQPNLLDVQKTVKSLAITPPQRRKRRTSAPRRKEATLHTPEENNSNNNNINGILGTLSQNYYEAALQGRTLLFQYLQATTEKARSTLSLRTRQVKLMTVEKLLPMACVCIQPGEDVSISSILSLMSDASQDHQYIQLTDEQQKAYLCVSLSQIHIQKEQSTIHVYAKDTPVVLATMTFATEAQAGQWYSGIGNLTQICK